MCKILYAAASMCVLKCWCFYYQTVCIPASTISTQRYLGTKQIILKPKLLALWVEQCSQFALLCSSVVSAFQKISLSSSLQLLKTFKVRKGLQSHMKSWGVCEQCCFVCLSLVIRGVSTPCTLYCTTWSPAPHWTWHTETRRSVCEGQGEYCQRTSEEFKWFSWCAVIIFSQYLIFSGCNMI